ncbi:MmcQ/YjbR family DNA-binding protein [Streptomyces edwardsiae]|uniref:MmcQ/YjbR family DNA-binding protein n=1 Tax=Streptomyces edwardsiae TaxID=3075527 RepID=A0ABU2QJ96_9ACTN|nr:MmcQ/YjbR family DNA-binding protein [Streptomyces sp. DSM 41635]MDT0404546.1 MmcQ/YjbR family DNA-binding protein [Streptomyces sp. DSM 41635]
MAVPPNALKKWEKVRDRAPGLPEAAEDHPWGETVAEVDKKVVVRLGVVDGGHPLGVTVKLTDGTVHAHAMTRPGAAPAGYGPGMAGWARVPLEPEGPGAGRGTGRRAAP